MAVTNPQWEGCSPKYVQVSLVRTKGRVASSLVNNKDILFHACTYQLRMSFLRSDKPIRYMTIRKIWCQMPV